MEILFVYSLVLFFFLLTLLFVVVVLARHPSQTAAPATAGTSQSRSLQAQGFSQPDRKIVYATCAFLLVGLCILAVLDRKQGRARHP
jgi:preprotein translocase subunit SecG